jgi:hypothetical protein
MPKAELRQARQAFEKAERQCLIARATHDRGRDTLSPERQAKAKEDYRVAQTKLRITREIYNLMKDIHHE